MNPHHLRILTYLISGIGLGAALGAQAVGKPGLTRQFVYTAQSYAQSYTDWIANTLYHHYTLEYPAPVMTAGISSQQAEQLQVSFVRRLREELGSVVGFKAALTNPASQERFGVNHPLYGFLLEKMLLESGAKLPLRFGARPVAEGDLMVRVGSDSVNTAATDEELLASLDAVIPFMELPDLIYEEGAPVDAAALVVVNVGARYGVMGDPVDLAPSEEWMIRLGQIRVQLTNSDGQTLAAGESTALLGHPINTVRWLRDTLAAQGIRLSPGDLLSLGSLTPPAPLEAGQMRARYFGLDPNKAPERSLDISITLESED